MREIKHLLANAFMQKLANVEYLGVKIPIDYEFLSATPAQLNIGNSTGIQAYMLIQNQTTNDVSPKCGVIQNSSLQVDTYTLFNPNSGNYVHADLIGDVVLQTLMPGDSKQIEFEIDGLQVFRSWFDSSIHISEETPNKRIFRNLLIFQNTIAQLSS